MALLFNEIISPLMNSENSIVKDPLGNVIFLSDELCEAENESGPDALDPVARIIEAPAYMVEAAQKFYYIRAVDWENIMLVEAQLKFGKWLASICIKNPSKEFIRDIIKKGRLITKW